MRLSKPGQWIEMFNKTANSKGSYAIQEWILQGLRDQEGVVSVDLKWMDNHKEPGSDMTGKEFDSGKKERMRFRREKIAEVTPPQYDAKTGRKTVHLVSHFKDVSGRITGTLDVTFGFDFLFFGDGMLVFFDPLDGSVALSVKKAVECALEMQQAMAKGGEIVLSPSVYRHAAKDLMVRNSFDVQLKGVRDSMKLYVLEQSL